MSLMAAPPVIQGFGGYLCNDEGTPLNGLTFSLTKHLARYDWARLKDPSSKGAKYRRRVTRLDPLLFAVLYLRTALTNSATGGVVSFGDNHLDKYRHALSWIEGKGFAEHRHLWIEPRGTGKSTMMKILMVWAAVHGHQRFIAAFGSSDTAAKAHLDFLRAAFFTNTRLRRDWTIDGVCQLDTYKINGTAVTCDIALINGFRMNARGIDATALGMVDDENNRPTMILLDDIELDAGVYSIYQANQRKTTLLDKILPLEPNAIVEFIGTTTMAGGIVHTAMQNAYLGGGDEKDLRWVVDHNFWIHWYKPIIDMLDGSRRALWQQRFAITDLLRMEAKNSPQWYSQYMNMPMNESSIWFQPSDFVLIDGGERGELLPPMRRVILSFDPAVTKSDRSDRTAAVVLGEGFDGCVYILEAKAGRWNDDEILAAGVALIGRWPAISKVIWESVQGGDTLPRAIFVKDGVNRLGRQVITLHHNAGTTINRDSTYPTLSKEARTERGLGHYLAEPIQIKHRAKMVGGKLVSCVADLESELLMFPKGMHDDYVDAEFNGTWWLMDQEEAPVHRGPSKGWTTINRTRR